MKKLSFLYLALFPLLLWGQEAVDAPAGTFSKSKDFNSWVSENAVFPQVALDDGISGVADIKFQVDTAGRISRIAPISYPHQALYDELKRVLTSYTEWPVQKKDGKPIPWTGTYSFDFTTLLGDEEHTKVQVAETCLLPRFDYHTPYSSVAGFNSYLRMNSKLPANMVKDAYNYKIDLSMKVDAKGKISEISVSGTDNQELVGQLTKLAKRSKWDPGEVNGKKHQYTIYTTVNYIRIVKPDKGNDSVESFVEENPKFMGGDPAIGFRQWVAQRLEYPRDCRDGRIEGRVIVAFVVEKDGSLSNFEIIQSPHDSLSQEAIRVVSSSPKWAPARQKNKEVRLRFILPVEFKLGSPQPDPFGTSKSTRTYRRF